MMNFGFGGFGMILVWVVIIAVIVVVVKMLSDSNRRRAIEPRSALEVLKERYAAGEIGREEFEEKKRDLAQR